MTASIARTRVAVSRLMPDTHPGGGGDSAGAAAPTAPPAQGVQAAIDGPGAPAGGNHVLAVGDEFVFGKALDDEGAGLDALLPGEEMPQIVAVAAQGRRRE